MRGSAVPTMVWSSAARKSASMIPTVTRTSRRPCSSPDNSGLLLRGWGDEDVVEVRDRGAHAGLLLGGEAVEALGELGRHEVTDPLELGLALVGELDDDRAPIGRIVHPARVALGDQALDDLAHRRRRGPAERRELAGPDRAAAAQDPEGLVATDGAGAALAHGAMPELTDPGEAAERRSSG